MAATSKKIGPVVSRSVGDNHKPIIGLNGLEMVKKIDVEGRGLIEGNRFWFLFWLSVRFDVYIYVFL